MTVDFIFCPLCGATKWLTNKTRASAQGRLTEHRCSGCKNFTYTNVTCLVKHAVLVGITQSVRHSIEATIKPYKIGVFYQEPIVTNIWDSETSQLLLSLNSAVTFNWYKNEELIEKVKKYILFS
jgi:hypothetical protein